MPGHVRFHEPSNLQVLRFPHNRGDVCNATVC